MGKDVHKVSYPKHDYDEYPKTLPADDFWGQVRRTVNGESVGAEQIGMIVSAVRTALALEPSDGLLDIACGNGALSKEFFGDVECFLGIDSSEYLISVANRNFADLPRYRFERVSVRSFVSSEQKYSELNKAMCYGSFSYFSKEDGEYLLQQLPRCCPNIYTLFIGNNPDLERAQLFYKDAPLDADILKSHQSQIGIWRSEAEFVDLAHRSGWECEVRTMPREFYASHYRFDIVLRRNRETK